MIPFAYNLNRSGTVGLSSTYRAELHDVSTFVPIIGVCT
jgi:hypothetical protein